MADQDQGRDLAYGATTIPSNAGIGLRHPHIPNFIAERPHAAWLEVHTENYVGAGGPRLRALEKIRQDYPLSCHGVGLSLGSAEGLDDNHLARIKSVVDRFQPGLVSEHVSWSVTGGVYLNDLLPLPYTDEALDTICRNIAHAQEALGRQILVENPSSYVSFKSSTMPEWEFMAAIVKRTGCGLLLDVNNIHVSAHNHRFDANAYLDAVPLDAVQEIHVAGHFVQHFADDDGNDRVVLIDDHGTHVEPAVWTLFRRALDRVGPMPTLVEWDNNIPELDVLLGEARKAELILSAVRAQFDNRAKTRGSNVHVA